MGGMQFYRFALIGLSDPAPAHVLMSNYRSTLGMDLIVDQIVGAEPGIQPTDLTAPTSFHVQCLLHGSQPVVVVLVHGYMTGLPVQLDNSGRICIPEKPRQQAEATIEEFANLLSVAHQCRRTVRSPRTCVALVPESEDEFGNATELSLGKNGSLPNARLLPELCVDKVSGLISDRLDGLRLLASGLSEESPGGRAREYYRLIEAAFGKGIGALKKPLYEFLATTSDAMQYNKKETDKWVTLRGKVMHGDTYAASSSDVLPFLARLEWAAYDLLLHKRNWRTVDIDRRQGLPIMSGVNGTGSLTLFHPSSSVQIAFTDPFGVYATDWNATVNLASPGLIVNSVSDHGEQAEIEFNTIFSNGAVLST